MPVQQEQGTLTVPPAPHVPAHFVQEKLVPIWTLKARRSVVCRVANTLVILPIKAGFGQTIITPSARKVPPISSTIQQRKTLTALALLAP
jgi:tRNA A37 threonylcarbamoyladenosine synthetase subunit TsaC/SUA5/YrdC